MTPKTDEFTHIFLIFGKSAFNKKKKKKATSSEFSVFLDLLLSTFYFLCMLLWHGGLGWLCCAHVSCRSGAPSQAVVHSDITSSSMCLMD